MLFGQHPFKKHIQMPDELNALPFTERIRTLASLAASVDPLCRIFGAEKHRYGFAEPASAQAVQAVQEQLGVTFPASYAAYLTQLGNGGAGPHYGLYSLEELIDWNDYLPDPETSRTAWLHSRLSPEEWAQAAAAYKDTEDDTAFQALWHRMMHGALTIGTQGCTLDTLLLCDGADAGQVVYFDWSMFEGNPPFFTGKSFEEWMEGYFRKVIAGDIQRCSHVHWSVDW